MNNKLFDNKYLIDSARYIFHEYNRGEYFITICTKEHQFFFGQIKKNDEQVFEMHLSDIGQFVKQNIQNISEHYPYTNIPIFTIMPNHIHLIVIINDIDSETEVCETGHANRDFISVLQNRSTIKYKGKLSVAMGGLKSAVTKYAKKKNISFEWQTRFYDHIIRSQEEMNNIVSYIETNVFNWGIDKYYLQ